MHLNYYYLVTRKTLFSNEPIKVFKSLQKATEYASTIKNSRVYKQADHDKENDKLTLID